MNPYVNQTAVTQLRQEVGEENIPILFGIFCDELSDFIGALSSHPEVNEIREISHSLKSSAGSFGADKLATMAISVEEKAKQDQAQWLERNISDFVEVARQTEIAYRELLM